MPFGNARFLRIAVVNCATCARYPPERSLSRGEAGDRVNIEVDQMARYAARLMEAGRPR
jgi:riboflavin synthase alpha subunit